MEPLGSAVGKLLNAGSVPGPWLPPARRRSGTIAFWHSLSTLHFRYIWGNEKSSQNFVTLESA